MLKRCFKGGNGFLAADIKRLSFVLALWLGFGAHGNALAEFSYLQEGLSAGGLAPRVVKIPPGKLVMGSPATEKGRSEDEGPARAVNVEAGFFMSVTELLSLARRQARCRTRRTLATFAGL